MFEASGMRKKVGWGDSPTFLEIQFAYGLVGLTPQPTSLPLALPKLETNI